MSDVNNFSASSVIPPRASDATPSSGKLTASNKDRALTTGNLASVRNDPQVAITEVAKTASQDKQHSLETLNQSANELRDAITTLNAALQRSPTTAIITRDDDLNRFIVKIADESSGEIVREIPSEALLKFARNLQELKGLIFDKSL